MYMLRCRPSDELMSDSDMREMYECIGLRWNHGPGGILNIDFGLTL